MADASWLPDPSGTHELRYWNGSSWTEHVSDQGTTGQEPLSTEFPPPADAFPPPPTPPPAGATSAPAGGGKVSWKDRLEQGAGQVVLDDVEGPYAVLDLLAPLISEARQKKTVERQSQYLHVHPGTAGAAFGAPAASPPAAEPQPDLADQLRTLADLRDAGILTDEEFAAQKAKLLG